MAYTKQAIYFCDLEQLYDECIKLSLVGAKIVLIQECYNRLSADERENKDQQEVIGYLIITQND